jgi:hypothetical protein
LLQQQISVDHDIFVDLRHASIQFEVPRS